MQRPLRDAYRLMVYTLVVPRADRRTSAASAASSRGRWVLLIPSVPGGTTSARVRVWRRLQSVGAIAVKNSVYVLPNTEACVETFQWVSREIVALGGQASLCEAHFIDGVSDADIERRFEEARNADYAALAGLARKVLRALAGGRLTAKKRATLEAEVGRLQKRRDEVVLLDFAQATGREAVDGLLSQIGRDLSPESSAKGPNGALSPLRRPRGGTWVTRAGVHVDRIACAWLVRRFIDPRGKLKFVQGKTYTPAAGELRFDMFDAELTHVGDRCSFEVMLTRFGLADVGLVALGEIVHDIDMKDEKFGRPETSGVRSTILGIAASIEADDARIAAATPLLDSLHAFFSRKGMGR